MSVFTFEVRGLPQPKGSARAFVPRNSSRAIVTSDNPRASEWARIVRFCLQDWSHGLLPATLGVALDLHFRLPRPPSVSERRRPQPTVLPDLDKLARTVLDALTGIVYGDDAQVTEIRASKVYSSVPGLTGSIRWAGSD